MKAEAMNILQQRTYEDAEARREVMRQRRRLREQQKLREQLREEQDFLQRQQEERTKPLKYRPFARLGK